MDGIDSNSARRPAPPFIERRRHPRVGVAWMATFRTGRGIHECMVIDVSAGGAKLTFTEPPLLTDGMPVTLDLGPRGALRAHLAWQRANFAGIRFADPHETIAAALRGVLPT